MRGGWGGEGEATHLSLDKAFRGLQGRPNPADSPTHEMTDLRPCKTTSGDLEGVSAGLSALGACLISLRAVKVKGFGLVLPCPTSPLPALPSFSPRGKKEGRGGDDVPGEAAPATMRGEPPAPPKNQNVYLSGPPQEDSNTNIGQHAILLLRTSTSPC